MPDSWEEIKADFKKMKSLSRIRSIYLPIIAILVTAIGVFNNRTLELKLSIEKAMIMNAVEEATELANEVIKKLKNSPIDTLPGEMNVFEDFTLDTILPKIDFDHLDMNIKMEFVSSRNQARFGTEINYGIGEYKIKPNTGFLVLEVFNEIFERKLSTLFGNKQIKTNIKGVADGIPVRRGAVYSDDLLIENREYFNINENIPKSMTLIPHRSEMKNETFAFLRAYYAYLSIRKIESLRNAPIRIFVEEVKEIGQRKTIIAIEMKVEKVLYDVYKDLNTAEKIIFNIKY